MARPLRARQGGGRGVDDVVMSEVGQRAMVGGQMHSANPRIAAPKGAPTFEALLEGGFVWSEAFTAEVEQASAEIKTRFAKIMNE